MENANKKISSNVMWSFGERIAAQLVTLLVSIVLARILSPDEYAIIAIVMIFITIANVFVSSGFGIILIRKKDADEFDFSTVLYASLVLSVVFYLALFFCSPLIAKFYNTDILTPVVRILGIRLIFAGVNTIQHAYVSKQMAFRKFFFSTLIGTVVSAVVGVAMALCGCGVWSIVAQYLTNTIIDTVVLSFTSGWKPKLYFSWKRFKKLIPFGSFILLSDLIATLFNQLRGLVLAKYYSKNELSYYNQADKYTAVFVNNVEVSTNKVMVQVQSNVQDKKDLLKQNTRTSIKTILFIVAPIQIGLAFTSFAWVPLLLTDKWIGCIPYVIITAIFYIFFPLIESHTRNIIALGRGKLFFILHAIRYSIGVGTIALCVAFSESAWLMIAVSIITQVIAYLLFAYFDGKEIEYTAKEQFKDLFPVFISAITMGAVVFAEHYLPFGDFLVLVVQIVSGVAIYFVMTYFLAKNECVRVLRFVEMFVNSFISLIKKPRKIKISYVGAAVFIVALGCVSIFARESARKESKDNLLSITLQNAKYSDDIAVTSSGRYSYKVEGSTSKNLVITIGKAELDPGVYRYSGIYDSGTYKGVARFQLFEGNKSICQFGDCTDKEYDYVTVKLEKKTDVTARIILFEGWEGELSISPAIAASDDTNFDYIYGGAHLNKPMMTIIDDDGYDEFLYKWLPFIEKYNVPVASAIVSDWADNNDSCMNWEELRYAKEHGAEIVSHGENHNDNEFYEKGTVQSITESFVRAKEKMKTNGVDTDVIVFPGQSGKHGNVRAAGKNVFKVGVNVYGDKINQKEAYSNYNVYRYDLITTDSSTTYFKSMVDNVISTNGWLVWKSHSQYEELDETMLSMVGDMVDYCKKKGVDIVGVQEGYDRINQ